MLNLNWNIIWTFVNIIVLYILLRIFLFKPVCHIIQKRTGEINSSLNDAEAAKKEAAALRTTYSEKLRDAENTVDNIIEGAKAEARVQRDSIINKAKQDADSIIKEAEKQIEADKRRSMDDVRSEIADIALLAARKAMEDKSRFNNSFESFLDQVGEPNE